jgi:hypothetical protein
MPKPTQTTLYCRAVIANAIQINTIDNFLKLFYKPRPPIWHICFCATQYPTLMQKQKSQMLTHQTLEILRLLD